MNLNRFMTVAFLLVTMIRANSLIVQMTYQYDCIEYIPAPQRMNLCQFGHEMNFPNRGINVVNV